MSLPLAEAAAAEVNGVLTFHPAAILRTPSSERRREMRQLLVDDLALAAREAGRRCPMPSST